MNFREIMHLSDTDIIRTLILQKLGSLPMSSLALDVCAGQGGLIDDSSIQISMGNIRLEPSQIIVDVRIFFVETIGGCSCGDGSYEENGLCGKSLLIDRADGHGVWCD